MSCVAAMTAGRRDGFTSEAKADRLGCLPLLSAREEQELARQVAAGDLTARAHLIRSNLRLVVKIARAFEGCGVDRDDLIGEGNLGLIRAAERFDPSFGTRFGTYAGYWIKESIRRALMNTSAVIRLPAHVASLLRSWRRCERTLAKDLRRGPTHDEVADRLGLTETQRDMVEKAWHAGRLRLTDWSDGDRGGSSDDAAAAVAPVDDPCATASAVEDRVILRGRLDRLDAREREVVTLRFGLDGTDPLTLSELGRRLGVTRETVRKIEAKAIQKLR